MKTFVFENRITSEVYQELVSNYADDLNQMVSTSIAHVKLAVEAQGDKFSRLDAVEDLSEALSTFFADVFDLHQHEVMCDEFKDKIAAYAFEQVDINNVARAALCGIKLNDWSHSDLDSEVPTSLVGSR